MIEEWDSEKHKQELLIMHRYISRMPGQVTRTRRIEALMRTYGVEIPPAQTAKRQKWAAKRINGTQTTGE